MGVRSEVNAHDLFRANRPCCDLQELAGFDNLAWPECGDDGICECAPMSARFSATTISSRLRRGKTELVSASGRLTRQRRQPVFFHFRPEVPVDVQEALLLDIASWHTVFKVGRINPGTKQRELATAQPCRLRPTVRPRLPKWHRSLTARGRCSWSQICDQLGSTESTTYL